MLFNAISKVFTMINQVPGYIIRESCAQAHHLHSVLAFNFDGVFS